MMKIKDRTIKDIAKIIIGGFIMGFSLVFFLVPSNIAAGGVSGISTVLYRLFSMPIGTTILLLNIPIFVLGFINFNSRFLVTSIIGTLALSVSSRLFESGFIMAYLPSPNDVFLCSVLGGGVYGFGLGLTLSSGGTTGGTDILSLVLKKRFPSFSVGQFIIIIDGIIITVAAIAFKTLDTALYSSVMLFVSSAIADIMLGGINFAKTVYIISENETHIAKEIAKKLGRGSTALLGFSLYSNKTRNVLMCVVKKRQLPFLKEIVLDVDKDAFMIVSDAKEVLGNGFGYLK